MRYMMLIYSREDLDAAASPEAMLAVQEGHRAAMQEAAKKGVLRGAEKLRPTSTSTTVHVQNGQALTTDGPFAETKEQLAGFYILECQNLDEAIDWAKKIPTACMGGEGCVEIRPIVDISKPIA
jgi:hypothetical protein